MDARRFAEEWAAAWTARDLDAILAHYHHDVRFVSPRAAEITGSAVVIGREALRAYWTAALAHVASLRFTVERVVGDEQELVVVYRSERDGTARRAAEYFRFDGSGAVTHGEAWYGAAE